MNFFAYVILTNYQSLKRFDSFDIFDHSVGKKSPVESFGVIRFCICANVFQLNGIFYLCPLLSFLFTILFDFTILFGFAILVFWDGFERELCGGHAGIVENEMSQ